MSERVFIGWDSREAAAYDVAAASIRRRASAQPIISPLRLELMRHAGYLWRAGPVLEDLPGDVPPSTEFGRSRFLVPFLQDFDGFSLFADCDVVALADIAEAFAIARAAPEFAVHVVKHDTYLSTKAVKMDGRRQLGYYRKNWSSIVLWNSGHHAHRRLSLHMLNYWPRHLLHGFPWLRDEEIGELPAGWNWLVGEQPRPADPKIAHLTLGGPWLKDWAPREYDDLWLAEQALASRRAA